MEKAVTCIIRWLTGSGISAQAFCEEVQRLLGRKEPPWEDVADCLRRHPQMPRKPQIVAAMIRGEKGQNSPWRQKFQLCRDHIHHRERPPAREPVS